MKSSLTELVRQFLTIVAYPNDKEAFIAEFEELNRIEAISNILETLPKDIQKKVIDNPAEIEQYIPAEKYAQELTKISELALAEHIKTTLPLLTLQQKEKILQLLLDSQGSLYQTTVFSLEKN